MPLGRSGSAGALALAVSCALTGALACSEGADGGQLGGSSGSPSGGNSTSGSAALGGTNSAGSAVVTGGSAGEISGGGMAPGGSGGSATAGGESGGSGGGPAPGVRDLSTDRNQFFGASRCAQAKVQFCEDFESGTLDTTTWKTGGTPAPVIDELQAARGKKALHFSKDGNGNTTVAETKTFPAMNGKYWGRAFVYLNAMPKQVDAFTYSHWTIIAATGAVVDGEVRIGGQMQKRFGGATSLNYWGVGTDNRNQAEGSGDWTNADNDPAGAAKPVAEKEWTCLEWMGDYTADATKFFIDGVEHPSLATTPATKHGGNPDKPFLLPEFNRIWFGWAEYQATTQKFELWFDEIMLDPERMGCVL